MAKQTYTTGQVLTAAQMTALQANDYNWTVSAKTASYVLVAADAGTRITMSNAGATTITVNTALFTAGDTLTITNIGAGACTITAGTATVSTAGSLILNQYDSGTLYFSSTSAAIWNGANPGDITGITTGATSGLAGGVTSGTASLTLATAAKGDLLVGTGANTAQVLTVGTNNQTLVADSTAATGLKWATASSGALTKITSSTFTNSASVTIDSVFSSTYKSYMVILSLFSVSVAADDLLMQMRYGGTTQTGSNYLGSQFMYNRNNSLGTGGYTNLAQATLSTSISTSGTPTVLTMYFDQVGNTSERATWYGNGIDADVQAASVFAGVINVGQTYDGFLIKGSSVNITGRYAVYGLAN